MVKIWKTDKDMLSSEDILGYIKRYENESVPMMDKLWDYYLGKNTTILSREHVDPNAPDNRSPVPYGRKIVTTFTGYGYRPGYISETILPSNDSNILTEEEKAEQKELERVNRLNREGLKNYKAGRNSAVFGVAYELLYVDRTINAKQLQTKAEVKFINVDPRQLILLFDYSPEPQKKFAIRFIKIDANTYFVEVYDDKIVTVYRRIKQEGGEWMLIFESEAPHWIGGVPVCAYYVNEEGLGILEPVLPLIDDYDLLTSDSMNEFDRFAHAYLVMKKFGLTDSTKKKDPWKVSAALAFLKRFRIFEHVPADAEISFLTKEMPKDFIEFATKTIAEQIHIQSHVPDFKEMATGGLSGIAVQRLMFDFENVVSSAEAEFDVGLSERIKLIGNVYKSLGRPWPEIDQIVFKHKRNIPFNTEELADTAVKLKQAGMSRWLIADMFPDDIIPNIEEELKRQDEDARSMMPDIDSIEPEVEDGQA